MSAAEGNRGQTWHECAACRGSGGPGPFYDVETERWADRRCGSCHGQGIASHWGPCNDRCPTWA